MREESNCSEVVECLCPIRGIIDVVSKKWTICIISLLEKENPIRYNEIKNKLGEISPKAQSDILKILEKEGLIERKFYAEIPPRVEYSLTAEGKELKTSLLPLVRWVQKKKK
ncbi:MAG: helix-turn-helix transcriptional regulator [Thermoplasmatales archaeon]|nr:MAG: helix-turn-helix transcriptional regulator [Thermoplasmatales archaeon]